MTKLVDKTDYNSKIKYIEDKQPSISNLATAAALSAVGNVVSNISDVVKKKKKKKKTDSHAKTRETEGKYT